MPTEQAMIAATREQKEMRAAKYANWERMVVKFADGERTVDELATLVGCSAHSARKWVAKHGLKIGRKK